MLSNVTQAYALLDKGSLLQQQEEVKNQQGSQVTQAVQALNPPHSPLQTRMRTMNMYERFRPAVE